MSIRENARVALVREIQRVRGRAPAPIIAAAYAALIEDSTPALLRAYAALRVPNANNPPP